MRQRSNNWAWACGCGRDPELSHQTNIYPSAVNVPIACGGVSVLPGDPIVADDDGAVVVPIQLGPELVRKAAEHVEWEEFSRVRLSKVVTFARTSR